MAEPGTDQPMRDGLEAQANALEAELKINPSDYENHVQYIKILRDLGDKEKVRQAREKMNQSLALRPKMWREWTEDEKDGISSSSDVEAILAVEKLYQQGVSEYLSVDLWCDYLNFVQAHDPYVRERSPGGTWKARNLFQRALNAAGYHFTEGHRIWELYRKFEQDILIKETDSEAKENQIPFIRSLFQQQLGVPLSNLKSTLQAYKDWEAGNGISIDALSGESGDLPSPVLASMYKTALDMFSVHELFEENISKNDVDSERVLAYKTYLTFEHSCKNPTRIKLLYERAIADFPRSADLWLGYTKYLEESYKTVRIVRDTYNRATRNCPSVGKLWVLYLLSLERGDASEKELSDVFEKSLSCTFSTPDEYLNIFLTRVDGLRWKISAPKPWEDRMDYAVIRGIFQSASKYFPVLANTKSLFRLLSYWARLELKLGKDIDAARGVWERLIQHCGTMLETWQGFIAWEIGMGRINEARSLYKRCYSKTLAGTGSEDICHSWVRFEGEHGSLDDYDLAVQEVARRLHELQQESKNIGQATNEREKSSTKTTHEKRGATSSTNDEQSTAKRQKTIP